MEVGKRLRKKLDLANAMPLAIERLLPDECGSCKSVYTVRRDDKPTLQCAGCNQGIHEECLKEVLGEATTTLSTLHGSLTWLCQACTPSYCMMTVMGEGGVHSRPVNRRRLAVPLGQTSAAAPGAVDDITDRLAAINIESTESNQSDSNTSDTGTHVVQMREVLLPAVELTPAVQIPVP